MSSWFAVSQWQLERVQTTYRSEVWMLFQPSRSRHAERLTSSSELLLDIIEDPKLYRREKFWGNMADAGGSINRRGIAIEYDSCSIHSMMARRGDEEWIEKKWREKERERERWKKYRKEMHSEWHQLAKRRKERLTEHLTLIQQFYGKSSVFFFSSSPLLLLFFSSFLLLFISSSLHLFFSAHPW